MGVSNMSRGRFMAYVGIDELGSSCTRRSVSLRGLLCEEYGRKPN